jgi:hypothetical protein
MFWVFVSKLDVRYWGGVLGCLADLLHVLEIPVLDCSVSATVGQREQSGIEF